MTLFWNANCTEMVMSNGSKLSDLLGDAVREGVSATRASDVVSYRPIEQEDTFLLRIAQECRRAERSQKRFGLLLIHECDAYPANSRIIAEKLTRVTREIDTIGWYQTDTTLGIIFVEFGDAAVDDASSTIVQRIRESLNEIPGAGQIGLSLHLLPRDLNNSETGSRSIAPLLGPFPL